MKKKYIKPNVTITDVKWESSLMAGSPTQVEGGNGVGETPPTEEGENPTGSKGGSLWDEDWD